MVVHNVDLATLVPTGIRFAVLKRLVSLHIRLFGLESVLLAIAVITPEATNGRFLAGIEVTEDE